jgi:hypothetical protein
LSGVAYFGELGNFSSTFEAFGSLYSISTLLLIFSFGGKGKWDAYEGWMDERTGPWSTRYMID